MKDLTISAWGGFYKGVTPEQLVDRFLAAGLTACEFDDTRTIRICGKGSAYALKRAREIRTYAEDHGFSFPQAHTCFRSPLLAPGTEDILKGNLDFFLELGVKNAVVHVTGGSKNKPDVYEDAKREQYPAQLEAIGRLRDYVDGTPLWICLENLGSSANTHTADRLMDFIRDLGSPDNIGICLDTGHLHRVNGNGWAAQTFPEFIGIAGDRLRALHITGNEGIEDSHFFPFTGRGIQPDWKAFTKAIVNGPYKGLFNFEVPGETQAIPQPVTEMKLRYAAELGRYMLSDEFTAQ